MYGHLNVKWGFLWLVECEVIKQEATIRGADSILQSLSTHSRSPYGIWGFITSILLHQNTTLSYPKPYESIAHISTLIFSLKIIISKHSALLKVSLVFVTALCSTNMIGSSWTLFNLREC